MKKQIGIQLQLSEKELKKNWLKIFLTSGKAMIMFAAGKPDSGLKELVSYGENISAADTIETIALNFVVGALEKATYDLLEENRASFRSDLDNPEELEGFQLYAKFLSGITAITKDKEIFIDKIFIDNPRSLEILPDFMEQLDQWLQLFEIPSSDTSLIINRFPAYFVFALHDLYRKNLSQYDKLAQQLDNKMTPAVQREIEWEAYYSYLELQTRKGIFAEKFGLERVFIPLRAYYEKKNSEITRHERRVDRGDKTEKIVIPLQETLDKWLNTPKAKDEIKILSGGPGSGKSSFAKMWAASIATQRKIPIIFIPLHLFNINSDVTTALGQYLKGSPDIPLNYNPLEAPRPEDKLLIIFDGLDELVMQGKTSQQSAIDFIEELRLLCNRINGEQKRLKILVAGRPIAVQNAENRLRGTQEQVIHLLPYYLTKEEIEKYGAGKKTLEIDQRQAWWDNFYKIKVLSNNNGLPEELRNKNIDKLTAEPLLNYLVALAWLEDPTRFGEKTNINEVYELLMQGVYRREYGQDVHKGVKGLEEYEFFQILEEIAVCAWHGGDVRVTTTKKIADHIQGKNLGALLERYRAAAKGGITRLLTAFYFRKFGTEENTGEATFEFTHKSFGEYLTAKALVELLDQIDYDLREFQNNKNTRRPKGINAEEALERWLKITGPTALNINLVTFIQNEIRLRKEIKGQPIGEWQETLCRLIESALKKGLPFKEIRYSQLEEQRQARNASEALMILLSACSQNTKKISEIDWGGVKEFSRWLSNIFTTLTNGDIIYEHLHYISAKKAQLNCAQLIEFNLSNANLSNANLSNANLNNANLDNANLSYANLGNANLSYANLSYANLNHAHLGNANLSNANLNHAHLGNANLSNANLSNAIGIKIEQLASAKNLTSIRGLPLEMEKNLRKKYPHLFKDNED